MVIMVWEEINKQYIISSTFASYNIKVMYKLINQ